MKNNPQRSFKFISTLALSVLILLLGISVFGFQKMRQTEESSGWVKHTLNVIAKIHELESSILQLGNDQRGYIITGQLQFREKFFNTLPVIDKNYQELKALIKDNQEQLTTGNELYSLIEHKKVINSHSVDLKFKNDSQGAIDRVKTGEGLKNLEEIKSVLNMMIQREQKLLEYRLHEEVQTHNTAHMLFTFSTIGSFFVLLASFFFMREEFLSRQKVVSFQDALLRSAGFAIIATDKDGHITLFNPAAEDLLGYSVQEMVGKNPEIYHSKEEVKGRAQVLSDRYKTKINPGFDVFTYRANHNITEADQWTFVRKDGTEVQVNLTVSAIRDLRDVVTGYVGLAYDITQRLEFERAIIKASKEALAGTKAKSEFVANMSHEIRTPMNAILGMAELLTETPLNNEQRKYVDIFQRSGESLLSLINDILDFSKIEAGHLEIHHSPFRLSQTVEKTVEMMGLKAHQKSLELVLDMDDKIHDGLIGDEHRIRQVLVNLLGNAIKFTKEGEILLSVKSLQKDETSQTIRFDVKDTGIGMDEKQFKKVFERFSQADSSITKEYGGSGLGLSISKKLIQMMGGNIFIQSKLGEGSTFSVELSLPMAPYELDTHDNIDLKGQNILVVDDTDTNRMILKRILETRGAKVVEASGAQEALSLLQKSPNTFQLILLDGRMPKMDGFTLAEKIQTSDLKGPLLLMLTSDHRPGDLIKAKSLGIRSYLVKPILKSDLLKVIDKSLKEAQPEIKVSTTSPSSTQNYEILLVDDNDENRLVIKAFLRHLPWTLQMAKNGQEAVTYFQNHSFDLILMDIQMPVMDGFAATAAIRAIEKEKSLKPTPIVALTAYAMKEEIDKSIAAGCNGHVAKPISKVELIKKVEEFAVKKT